jgi:hypothetical protein
MATPVTTVGFLGTGKTNSKNINALLEDYVDAKNGSVRFILPLTVGTFTETIEYVYEFALNYDIDIQFVIDKTTSSNKKLLEISEKTGGSQSVEGINKGVTGILIASDKAELIIAWDDEDEACLDALDAAVNHSIPAFDLTTGLSELEFDGEDTPVNSVAVQAPVEVEDEEDEIDEEITLESVLLRLESIERKLDLLTKDVLD